MTQSLKSYQMEMLNHVFGPEVPEDPELALYREMTRFSIQEALDAIFPVTCSIYKGFNWSPHWQELGNSFLSQHWPTDFRVNWAAEKFSTFLKEALAGISEAPEWPSELADFEWVRFKVNTSRDPEPGDFLNPSLVLRDYQYAIPAWYSARYSAGANPAPVVSPSALAFFRDPVSLKFRALELQPAAYDLLTQWLDGETPRSVSILISRNLIRQNLNRSAEEIYQQILPLVEKLTQEGIVWSRNPPQHSEGHSEYH